MHIVVETKSNVALTISDSFLSLSLLYVCQELQRSIVVLFAQEIYTKRYISVFLPLYFTVLSYPVILITPTHLCCFKTNLDA